jgi:hypothetical protein
MKKSLDLAAPILTALLLLFFAVLAVRGMIDPQGASARFGTTVSDSAGALFYKVYLSRNLVIAIAGAALLILRMWKALAILVSASALLPIFDMAVLSQNGVTPPAFHPIALVLLAVAAALLWRRARSAAT